MSAAKKKTARAPTKRAATKPLDHYLGCFVFDEFSDRESTGSFQILVQALGPKDAADRCHALLDKLRTTTTLFARPCSIYIDGIIHLCGSFENGLLVNYSSTISENLRARISCLIPEQEHDAESYGAEEDATVVPFIDFGGQALVEQRDVEDESRAKDRRRGPTN